jgi:hypothetical protein
MMVVDEDEEEEEEGPQNILRFASVDFYHRSKVENNSWGLNLTPPLVQQHSTFHYHGLKPHI